MFHAPDPGRMRLRSGLRAVLGIGLAVTLSGLVGHSLAAAITAGLAALLALFTVADSTVGKQAVTTALLPVVGFPVLALATSLHDHSWLRDGAFLAVVCAGVYARRWGPRGHALGIFAFMTFFMTQFLHAVPAQLPELFTAVALALLASSTVRFGFWCYERRVPPPVLPVPAPARGFARVATRQAIQATVASAFALAIGQYLSEDRWYWAVGTVWWIFVNTTSRGETLVRGFRRVAGTLTGISVGLIVAVELDGAPVPTAILVAVCVFGIFYTAAVSYTWMMLAVTLMAGLLYGLLGVLDHDLLVLRLAETGVGALGVALAVLLVLPVSTHATTDAWIHRAVQCVHTCTSHAADRLGGKPDADPAVSVAELELLLGRVRHSLAPLVHPLSPLRARKARARQVLALLDECAREARGLAGIAADSEASHDARLTAACWRVERAVEALITPGGAQVGAQSALGDDHAAEGTALVHLHAIERALGQLAAPLGRERSPSTVGDC